MIMANPHSHFVIGVQVKQLGARVKELEARVEELTAESKAYQEAWLRAEGLWERYLQQTHDTRVMNGV